MGAPGTAAARRAPATAVQRVGSFAALCALHVLVALAYKAAQDERGMYRFDPAALLVVSEAAKLALSLALYARQAVAADPGLAPRAIAAAFTTEATATPGLARTALLLAGLYCVNNNLAFVLFQWADGANINLIKSGTSFVSTLLLVAWLRRAVSPVQWSAVGLQVAGLVVAQFGATCTDAPALRVAAYAALLVSLTITAVCSVLNDQTLKAHDGVASMHTVNALMYAGGTAANAAVYALTGAAGEPLFRGFGHWATWPVLACNALLGVAVSVVYKYSDATVKTFASAVATSVLMLINIAFYGAAFKLVVVAGCCIVFTATHLYATNPAPSSEQGPAGATRAVQPGETSAPANATATCAAP